MIGFESLFRITGGRREPHGLLLAVGHLAIRMLIETEDA